MVPQHCWETEAPKTFAAAKKIEDTAQGRGQNPPDARATLHAGDALIQADLGHPSSASVPPSPKDNSAHNPINVGI